MNCPVPKFDCKKTPDPIESDSAYEVNLLRFPPWKAINISVTDMPVHPGLYHMSDSQKHEPGMTAKEPSRRREDGICYTNTKMPKIFSSKILTYLICIIYQIIHLMNI